MESRNEPRRRRRSELASFYETKNMILSPVPRNILIRIDPIMADLMPRRMLLPRFFHTRVRRTCFAHFYPVCKEKGGAHERSYMMGLVHVSLHFVCSEHIGRVIRRSFRSSGLQKG